MMRLSAPRSISVTASVADDFESMARWGGRSSSRNRAAVWAARQAEASNGSSSRMSLTDARITPSLRIGSNV